MVRHAIVFAVAAAAALAARADPFLVPRAEFWPSLKVVAVAPIGLPKDLADPAVRRELQVEIERRLREAGLEVMGSEEVAAVTQATVKELGGPYDPMTGRLDAAKAATIDAEILGRLRAELHADALVEPAVVSRYARLTKPGEKSLAHRLLGDLGAERALEWDGVAELVEPHLAQELFVGKVARANVPALSLWVRVVGTAGKPLYENLAGIQLVTRIEGMKLVSVPSGELLRDHDKNAEAVRRALDPLFQEPAAPSSGK